MPHTFLTVRAITARPVVLKPKRSIVARIATITEWPLILVDLLTEEGIIGRSYLEPYIVKAMRYLVPALEDFGELVRGRRVAPIELFDAARKSLHFVGYEGLTMIAASGLDMAAWDALAKAANLPLCVLLGGSVGPVKSYNSNGLWLKEPEAVAEEALELRDEGGFTGLKLRLGRERASDDLATLDRVREAVGEEMHLMVDFNQGLDLAEALCRCHMIDDRGLDWIEEPIVYDNLDGYAQLAAELKTPLQMGENFLWPTGNAQRDSKKSQRSRDAGLHAYWRRDRLDASGRHRRCRGNTRIDAPLPGGRRPHDARHGDGALAGVARLGQSNSPEALHDQGWSPAHTRRAGNRPRMERRRDQSPCRVTPSDRCVWALCHTPTGRVDMLPISSF
jgi:mandelate racemase